MRVTSFDATNSVFNTTNENNSFPITIPGHWHSDSDEKTLNELYSFLELKSQKGIEIYNEQFRKKGLIFKKLTAHCLVLVLLKMKNLKY